jgi:hypothetical protein
MRNNVLGVIAGVSKMMPVITFLPVGSPRRGSLLSVLDVVVPGASLVAKSFAVSTLILSRAIAWQGQKIITMPPVVGLKMDSKRRTTAAGATTATV